MADKYLLDLAAKTGFTYVAGAKTFKTKGAVNKDDLIGLREGMLCGVGLVQVGNVRSLGLLVRYAPLMDVAPLQSALKALEPFKGFVSKKTATVAPGSVTIGWPLGFRKPKPEDMLQLLDAVIGQIKMFTAPLPDKCEECGGSGAGAITLMNGFPGHHCASCQMRMAQEQEQAKQQYAMRDSNFFGGLVAATLTAIVLGIAWGVGGYYMERAFDGIPIKLWAVIIIAMPALVGLAMAKGAGKVQMLAQAVPVALLSLGTNLLADVVYYSLVVANTYQRSFSLRIVEFVALNLWKLKVSNGWGILFLVCQVLGMLVGIGALKGAQPKFETTFMLVEPRTRATP